MPRDVYTGPAYSLVINRKYEEQGDRSDGVLSRCVPACTLAVDREDNLQPISGRRIKSAITGDSRVDRVITFGTARQFFSLVK